MPPKGVKVEHSSDVGREASLARGGGGADGRRWGMEEEQDQAGTS